MKIDTQIAQMLRIKTESIEQKKDAALQRLYLLNWIASKETLYLSSPEIGLHLK